MLIDALDKHEIEPWSLDFNTKRQFMMHKDQAIRNRLPPLFLEPPQEREKVFQEYKSRCHWQAIQNTENRSSRTSASSATA